MLRFLLLGAVAASALKVHELDSEDDPGDSTDDLSLIRFSQNSNEDAQDADATFDASSVHFSVLDAEDAAPTCGHCQLSECTFHDALRSPRLYVQEMSDGGGHRMITMLRGMAVAARLNMTFGGTLCLDHCNHQISVHKTNFTDDVNEFFKDSSASSQIFVKQDACHFKSYCHDNVQTLEKERITYPDAAEIRCKAVNNGLKPPLNDWFSPAVQARLRRGLDARPLLFERGRKSMAVHIRRGDLPRAHKRAYPNSYFLKLIRLVRQKISNIDVHVFSNIDSRKDLQYWKDSDFDEFRKEGVKVHLDEVKSVDAWAHFARADVLLASGSSFSYTGAVLNGKCIIGHQELLFDYWIDGQAAGTPEFRGQLDECLKRI